jgi:hypothetical protein
MAPTSPPAQTPPCPAGGLAHGGRIKLALAALTLLLCLPVLDFQYPPLTDYPSHIARIDILSRYDRVPAFQAAYRVEYAPIANLAMDLLLPPVARRTGSLMAGRLFLLSLIVLYAAGCYLLASAIHGRCTWLSLLPVPFIYNSTFAMGFLNYVAGIALFTISLACWLRWRDRWTALRWLAFTLLATSCYLAHLSAAAVLGVSVAAFVAGSWPQRRRRWKTLVCTAAAFVPTGLAYLSYMRGSGKVGTIVWNTAKGKFIAALVLLRTYDAILDAALIVGLLALLAFALRRARSVRVHWPAFAAGAALLVCFVMCPKEVFTADAVDGRWVWPGMILLLLSLRLELPRREAACCLAVFLGCFLIHTGDLWYRWRQIETRIAAAVSTFDSLPRQARIYPAVFLADDSVRTAKFEQAMKHVLSYATITRDAYVPLVFAAKGQQPLIDRRSPPWQRWTPQRGDVMRGFTHVWTYRAPPELIRQLERSAARIAQADGISLWRLTQP